MIRSFMGYEFEVFDYPGQEPLSDRYYYYRIYREGEPGYMECDNNMFQTEKQARNASVEHILRLIRERIGQ